MKKQTVPGTKLKMLKLHRAWRCSRSPILSFGRRLNNHFRNTQPGAFLVPRYRFATVTGAGANKLPTFLKNYKPPCFSGTSPKDPIL